MRKTGNLKVCDQCRKSFSESGKTCNACTQAAYRQRVKMMELEYALMVFSHVKGSNFDDCLRDARTYVKSDYKRAKRVLEGLGYVYDQSENRWVFVKNAEEIQNQHTA